MTPMVTLKDGEEVPQLVFILTTLSLRKAEKENCYALFDLFEKCKDNEYRYIFNPFGDTETILRKYSLLQPSGEVHEYIQSIVLNSVKISGMDLRLVNPISEGE